MNTTTPNGNTAPDDSGMKFEAYKLLCNKELELTKMRHAVFTSLLSISFIIPGLAIRLTRDNGENQSVSFGSVEIDFFGLIFMLGFIFYCFAVFHYWWYHRYSHMYRAKLKEMEKELGLENYTLRKRPVKSVKIGKREFKFKAHFDWSLYIIGLFYAIITATIVGWFPFLAVCFGMAGAYAVLFLSSAASSEEPLEKIHGNPKRKRP